MTNLVYQTQMMSSTGEQRANLFTAAKRLYGMGGIRAYYRGLVVRISASPSYRETVSNFRPSGRFDRCFPVSTK